MSQPIMVHFLFCLFEEKCNFNQKHNTGKISNTTSENIFTQLKKIIWIGCKLTYYWWLPMPLKYDYWAGILHLVKSHIPMGVNYIIGLKVWIYYIFLFIWYVILWKQFCKSVVKSNNNDNVHKIYWRNKWEMDIGRYFISHSLFIPFVHFILRSTN